MIASNRSIDGRMAIEGLTGHGAVGIILDGLRVSVSFEPSPREHRRRMEVSASAVTSLALLHGLWLLPEGWRVPIGDLHAKKVPLLRSAREHVDICDEYFVRSYRPAGTVQAVGLSGRHGDMLVDRAIRTSPIFARYVLVGPRTSMPSARALSAAREWGIGVVAVDESRIDVQIPAEPGVAGIPCVYRWWVAELAYQAWLYANAHDRS